MQERTRTCTNPPPQGPYGADCEGPVKETRMCNDRACQLSRRFGKNLLLHTKVTLPHSFHLKQWSSVSNASRKTHVTEITILNDSPFFLPRRYKKSAKKLPCQILICSNLAEKSS